MAQKKTVKIACKGADQADLAKLVHFQGGLKTLTEANYIKFRDQMLKLGFSEPISVWNDKGKLNVLNGHQRLAVLRRLEKDEGYAVPKIPINFVEAKDITEAKKKVLALTSSYGDMTTESLGDFLLEANLDLGDIAQDFRFLDVELEPIIDTDFSNDPDRSANTNPTTGLKESGSVGEDYGEAKVTRADLSNQENKPEDEIDTLDPCPRVSKKGDIWILGEHVLMCGDSISAKDVAKLFGSKKASLCFTSPPYAQQRVYGDNNKIDDWDKLMNGVFSVLPMTENGQVLVNLGLVHKECEWIPYWDNWLEYMRSIGWRRFGLYIWDQGPGLPGDWNGRLAPSFELIFHFNKSIKKPNKIIEKKPENISYIVSSSMRSKDGSTSKFTSPELGLQTHKINDSVVRILRHYARGSIENNHPALFPIKLPERIMLSYSDPGEIVYEPFSGAGTSIIAAEQNDRICYAMELEPSYVDIAITRWQQITGKTAIHKKTGKAFAELIEEPAYA